MTLGKTFSVAEPTDPYCILDQHLRSMVDAVEHCFSTDRKIPALVLLYSTIDCMA